jgi:hypothetical protein
VGPGAYCSLHLSRRRDRQGTLLYSRVSASGLGAAPGQVSRFGPTGDLAEPLQESALGAAERMPPDSHVADSPMRLVIEGPKHASSLLAGAVTEQHAGAHRPLWVFLWERLGQATGCAARAGLLIVITAPGMAFEHGNYAGGKISLVRQTATALDGRAAPHSGDDG